MNRLDLRGESIVWGGEWQKKLPRPDAGGEGPLQTVKDIIREVKSVGDDALYSYTEKFDGVKLESLRVPEETLAEALQHLPENEKEALREARDAIEAFHKAQCHDETEYSRDGIDIVSKQIPVDRAGVYVPGGRGAYPSSVLMSAIPALVAGVKEVVLCVPPDRMTGKVASITLAAAALAGVQEVYAIGGAQAIAAMAYGTESIKPVDVIAGPGNIYVALAKREVAGVVGIPSAFAGPSEIVVIADESVSSRYAAIDILVQAEHGPNGLAWLITWDEAVAEAVESDITELTNTSPRRTEIEATLRDGGYVVLVDTPEQAVCVANAIAPEHLQLMVADPESLVPLVRHAGAVFCGPLSPASFGDYLAGPSHVLPTYGSARYGSALTVDDFQKHVHVITVSEPAFQKLGHHVAVLAAAEGFDAHARSITIRQESESDQKELRI